MAENRKYVIALVIPSLGPGGMERVMSELAEYLSKKSNILVHVVLYGMNREQFYSVPTNIVMHKPNFIFNDRYRLLSTIKTSFSLRQILSRIKPDSILSFGEYWNSFVLLSLFALNYPVYISDRCKPDKCLGLIHDTLRRLLYPIASGVIVQTETARNIYSSFIDYKKLTVIGNPIRRIAVSCNVQKENIVLSVGRLIESKHHYELIRLFVAISKPGWRLVIVGGDALKQKNMTRLQSLIDTLGAKDTVELAGNQSNVNYFYQKSKIFAFTSSSEGFPNVVGEAMGSGLPVVSFNCVAGPSDMVTDGIDGFLIPLFDYSLFSNKLKLLMDNEELRISMGQMAFKNIKKYNIELIGKKYYKLLSDNK